MSSFILKILKNPIDPLLVVGILLLLVVVGILLLLVVVVDGRVNRKQKLRYNKGTTRKF